MQRLFNGRHSRSQASSTFSSNSNSEYLPNNKLKKPELDRNGDNNSDSRRKTHSEPSRAVGQLVSRTLTLASTSLGSSSSNDALAIVPRRPQPVSNTNVGTQQHVYYRARTQPTPLAHGGGSISITPREMYWASRAIQSETLLAATTHHHHEIKELMRSRADEILSITQEHGSRKAKQEWLLILLATTMILLSAYAIHLSIYPRQKPRGWINLTLPHHFTIPLLSPFASVVETESSVFNNRVIMLGLIVAGAVAYGLIRHRMNMKQGHGMPKTK